MGIHGAMLARDCRELTSRKGREIMCKMLVAKGNERFSFIGFVSIDDKVERAADWIRRGYRVMFR